MVELLIVVAVIGVMAGLAITAFGNASHDTRRVIARQQQIAVQNAVNAWVNAASSGQGNSLSAAMSAYNAGATSMGRLNIVKAYLDDGTYDHFNKNTTNNNQVQSSALSKVDQDLSLSTWVATSYPKVDLEDE